MTDYDKYIIAYSGGKDSTACLLHLLDLGIPKDKIELWHHDIDGNGEHFMDWKITRAYVRAFAKAMGVKVYFSWKDGGFLREMLREKALTAPTYTETPNKGLLSTGGTRGKLSTRRKFPQVSPNLQVRWCSSYLKIDVCSASIRMQDRFKGIRTLVISGERAEESAARAGYNQFEPDRSDNRPKRHVDRWRPIQHWTVQQVWEIIERYKIRAHPAYFLGFSRCSCLHCIFGNKDQFATSKFLDPNGFRRISDYEKEFGVTIKRDKDLETLVSKGKVYEAVKHNATEVTVSGLSHHYPLNIIMEKWKLPAGAYGTSCGPS